MALVLKVREASENELQALASSDQNVDLFLDPERSNLDLDKAWHAIHFLLSGNAFEADGPSGYLMMGGRPLGQVHHDYGPARALSPEEVKALYSVMQSMSDQDLQRRYRVEKMKEIYPGYWEPELNGEDFPYLLHYFRTLKEYLSKLVEAHKGAVVFLD